MLQIVTEFCLLHLPASHAGCKYFFLSSKVHAENFSRRYMCVCIATAVDFSIQVQMNQWKIVWLPVWMNLMLLLEVVLSLVRVHMPVLGKSHLCLQCTERNWEGSVSGSAMVFLIHVCADRFTILADTSAYKVRPVSSMFRNKLTGIGLSLCYGFPSTYLC